MGRQRNNPQMKGKEEASETMINEKEASQPSDTELKELVIRKLNELPLATLAFFFSVCLLGRFVSNPSLSVCVDLLS